MARMGNGYGSECHLLRYLGRHRKLLDEEVAQVTGATEVDWLDSPFDRSKPWLDGEWKGINFLRGGRALHSAWRSLWPARGNPPSWDAVGRVQVRGSWEWLLVEAKANAEELLSSCKASNSGGRPLIETTLSETKRHLGVDPGRDWLNGYYQFCNRLAVLRFLSGQGVRARLLFVYFIGDLSGPGRTCPQRKSDWNNALNAQKEHVGLPAAHPLRDRIHQLFLEVAPGADFAFDRPIVLGRELIKGIPLAREW